MATTFVDRAPTTCSILLHVAQVTRDISSHVERLNHHSPQPYPTRHNADRSKRHRGRSGTPFPASRPHLLAPQASPKITSPPPLPEGWERSGDFLGPHPSPFDPNDPLDMEETYFNAAHFLIGAQQSPDLAEFKLFLDEHTNETECHTLEPQLVPWLKRLSAEEWRLGAQYIWLHCLAPVEMELRKLCQKLIRLDDESVGMALPAWRNCSRYTTWYDPTVWIDQAVSYPPTLVTCMYAPNPFGTWPPEWYNKEMWANSVLHGWTRRNMKATVVEELRYAASHIEVVLLNLKTGKSMKNEDPNLWDFQGRRNDVDAGAVSPKTTDEQPAMVDDEGGVEGSKGRRHERMDSTQINTSSGSFTEMQTE